MRRWIRKGSMSAGDILNFMLGRTINKVHTQIQCENDIEGEYIIYAFEFVGVDGTAVGFDSSGFPYALTWIKPA